MLGSKDTCGCWNSNAWTVPLNGKGFTFDPKTGEVGNVSCMFCDRRFDMVDGKLIVKPEGVGSDSTRQEH